MSRMRRTNINAVLRMVKQFLAGKMDATSFWLDFPNEVTQRYEDMCHEDSEYAALQNILCKRISTKSRIW